MWFWKPHYSSPHSHHKVHIFKPFLYSWNMVKLYVFQAMSFQVTSTCQFTLFLVNLQRNSTDIYKNYINMYLSLLLLQLFCIIASIQIICPSNLVSFLQFCKNRQKKQEENNDLFSQKVIVVRAIKKKQ